jgi:RNA polymerase sigma-70 factor (ECF subfamily)
MEPSEAARKFASEAGKYRARLLKFARLELRDPAHAEDAVQDAMVAAIEGLGRYRGDAALGTWLNGILRHKMVDRVRAWVRERAAEPLPEELADERGCPEQAAWRACVLERIAGELAALPPKASQVFLMREVIGLSTMETCARLAISETYCGVLLHRARRRLRAQLAADGIGLPA